jgi:uncharacterized protein
MPSLSLPASPARSYFFGVAASLFLAGGLCFATGILANAWTRISEAQSINVTGSARRNVRSDLVVWRASFSADAPTLLEAQQKLRADHELVVAWLGRKSVADFTAKPVQIREITARDETSDGVVTRRIGYRLSQALEVRSPDVDRIPKLATESTELLAQGVTFVSDDFEFLFTRVGEAKVEMMAEATTDARTRAEQIAVQGGRQLKELRSARMGVVQVNPLHSTATSWEGNNDTSSLEKTITVTVAATFAMH